MFGCLFNLFCLKHNLERRIDIIYSKISNQLFYGFNGNANESILKQIDKKNNDKVLLILDYLYINRNLAGKSLFSLEDMICECGFQPHNGENGITSQFKSIMLSLNKLKVITLSNKDISLKSKQFYSCILNTDLTNNFFTLDNDNKKKILTLKSDVDNVKLLSFFCYLCSRMYHRHSEDKDIVKNGGKAEACYPSYEQISKDTYINQSAIKKYIDSLVALDLIRVGNAGQYYMTNDKNKKTYESNNTYVLYDENGFWEDELKYSLKAYKKLFADRVFVKGYINNDKSVNGYISRINYLESQGKASVEQISKKNELISNNVSDTKINLSIKSLLSNGDLPLYMIYEERNKEVLAEKYYELEYKFGLIDDNSNITVDREYYIWVLTNYQKFSEEHMINCIEKHKREAMDSNNEVPDEEANAFLEQELATGTSGRPNPFGIKVKAIDVSNRFDRYAVDEEDLF